MSKPTRSDTGAWGEALAARHLEQSGYVIAARNWRPDGDGAGRRLHGEIDIIARRGDTLVFVEVRTRHGQAFGSPEESLTRRKQAKLIETAQAYLNATLSGAARDNCAWRIDFIAVDLDARNAVQRLSHIEHAVAQP